MKPIRIVTREFSQILKTKLLKNKKNCAANWITSFENVRQSTEEYISARPVYKGDD